MKPMISEFSYGYALTEELASGILGPLVGAPIFPSLYEEGQPGGGYDLQLPLEGSPLFLQFKLSHYLKRSYATEWNYFSTSYYRMYLRPLRYSDQHELLVELERAGNEVYYAAPMFHVAEQLNDAYTRKKVFDRSVFISPLDIGNIPTDGEHYIVFNRFSSMAYFCSREPILLKSIYIGKHFVEKQIAQVKERTYTINRDFFERMADLIIGVLDRKKKEIRRLRTFEADLTRRGQTIKQMARFAAYLSRTYFDAELFIVGERT